MKSPARNGAGFAGASCFGFGAFAATKSFIPTGYRAGKRNVAGGYCTRAPWPRTKAMCRLLLRSYCVSGSKQDRTRRSLSIARRSGDRCDLFHHPYHWPERQIGNYFPVVVAVDT